MPIVKSRVINDCSRTGSSEPKTVPNQRLCPAKDCPGSRQLSMSRRREVWDFAWDLLCSRTHYGTLTSFRHCLFRVWRCGEFIAGDLLTFLSCLILSQSNNYPMNNDQFLLLNLFDVVKLIANSAYHCGTTQGWLWVTRSIQPCTMRSWKMLGDFLHACAYNV